MTERNAVEQGSAAEQFLEESIEKCMKEGFSRPQAVYMISAANYELRLSTVQAETEKAWLDAGVTFHGELSRADVETDGSHVVFFTYNRESSTVATVDAFSKKHEVTPKKALQKKHGSGV